MSYENVRKYFEEVGLGERIKVLENSGATVEMAAEAISCEVKQITKTLSFLVDDLPILIVAAGNVRVDNKKYKATFGQKPKMIPSELVEEYIGHSIGGVCPFAVRPNVAIYLDISLKSNDVVYPGAGNEHSIIELSMEELERYSAFKDWVDVSKE
jgi:prolyl-tRNA editing enzyme YbaK/EbsC (Cys-tRNA(Pro) deacylase)